MKMATSRGKIEAGLAETAARRALAIESEAEDQSRLADIMVIESVT